MPRWDPSPSWQGEDAYIIGGGDSLRSFDWDLIRGKNTIGCNGAYLLGVDVCKIVLFGDYDWWDKFGAIGTLNYGGLVVGSHSRLHNNKDPRLLVMRRNPKSGGGLGRTTLGWHSNTGAMAINLALILGAQRVFLLGFDMKLGPTGNANWHDERYEPAKPEIYKGFCNAMWRIVKTLPHVFPGTQIINVTNDSALERFPKVSLEEHFQLSGKVA